MMNQIKAILIGALVFSISWMMLIMMYNMVAEGSHLYQLADHNTYYMIAEAGTMLLIYCALFIPVKMIADKFRFDRGFIWIVAIPYWVCAGLTLFSFAVLLAGQNAYTICKRNDSDSVCQCKVEYLHRHFPKDHYAYTDIMNIDQVVSFGPQNSRKSFKFNLSAEYGKFFIDGDTVCRPQKASAKSE